MSLSPCPAAKTVRWGDESGIGWQDPAHVEKSATGRSQTIGAAVHSFDFRHAGAYPFSLPLAPTTDEDKPVSLCRAAVSLAPERWSVRHQGEQRARCCPIAGPLTCGTTDFAAPLTAPARVRFFV